MKSFLKTFGKGILYFILSPFALIFLSIFGIYLFFVNFFTFFKNLKKKNGMKQKVNNLDQKALNILRGNKYQEDPQTSPVNNTSNVTNNNIVITNKEDLLNLVNSLKQEENKRIDVSNPNLIEGNVKDNYIMEEAPLEVKGEEIKRVK